MEKNYSKAIATNEEGIKEVNKKGDKMALMFVSAAKLIESRKVGLPLKAPFLFISFNLMLYAAASVLFLRSREPFLKLFFCAVGF